MVLFCHIHFATCWNDVRLKVEFDGKVFQCFCSKAVVDNQALNAGQFFQESAMLELSISNFFVAIVRTLQLCENTVVVYI